MGLGKLDAIVIDGRSGSGKTSLADRIAGRLHAQGIPAQLLHVEDLYPGWDGLAAGAAAVPQVLREGSYRKYNWATGEFGDPVLLLPDVPLIIEGCGAVTADTLGAVQDRAGESVWSVWIEAPTAQRRTRALARDGGSYEPHWDRWAAQEDAFYATHTPWELVDEVLRS